MQFTKTATHKVEKGSGDAMRIYNSILELIGKTPLIRLNRVSNGIDATVLVKLESRNPGGSVKDRIGLQMIEAAEKAGILKPGSVIVEPTSGNTGIGLALAAILKGYRCVFVMTEKASIERRRYLQALGADIVLTSSAAKPSSPEYYVNVAKRLAKEIPNAVILNQYDNPANPEAHYRTTGPEIWEDTDGKITHFVAGIGTGGTLTGTARFLKEQNPDIQIIGVEPVGSVIKQFKGTGRLPEALPYLVEGVGQECIPQVLDLSLVDDILQIPDRDAFLMARRLARQEGIFTGGSSGMNVVAALQVARALPKDAVVVTVIADTGERYLTKVHSDEWLKAHHIVDPERLTLRILLDDKEQQQLPLLIAVTPDQSVQAALEKMTRYDISEMPVLANDQVVGKLRDNRLIALVIEDRQYLEKPVSEVMEEPMPTLDVHAPLTQAFATLRDQPSLVVTEYHRPIAVVTRHDILPYVAEKSM